MPEPSKIQFRRHRLETGLSQEDIAFLIGHQNASSVSRYEQQTREPTFRIALACEYILGAPVRTLFAPFFHDVGRSVRKRARERLDALPSAGDNARHHARHAHLWKLAEEPPTLGV